MLNSVSAGSTQPCLTPVVIGICSEYSPCTSMTSWNCRTIADHCYEPGWEAKLCHNFPKPITTACVKCFGKDEKGLVEVRSSFVLDISLSCLALKTMYIVPLSFLNPIGFLVEAQSDQDTNSDDSVGLLPVSSQQSTKGCLYSCHRLEHFLSACILGLRMHP